MLKVLYLRKDYFCIQFGERKKLAMLFTARRTQCCQPHGGWCKFNHKKMESNLNLQMAAASGVIIDTLRSIEQNTLLQAKQVLTTEDVMKLTGMSDITLRRYRMEKRIPYYRKTAKLIYYDKDEINAWMKENRVITMDEAGAMV